MVKIYGASDDLIEVEGEITEEFNAIDTSDEDPRFVVFSDGSVLRIWYDAQGRWRIERVMAGAATFSWTAAGLHADEDAPEYSDLVTMDDPANGGIKWIALAETWVKACKAVAKRVGGIALPGA